MCSMRTNRTELKRFKPERHQKSDEERILPSSSPNHSCYPVQTESTPLDLAPFSHEAFDELFYGSASISFKNRALRFSTFTRSIKEETSSIDSLLLPKESFSLKKISQVIFRTSCVFAKAMLTLSYLSLFMAASPLLVLGEGISRLSCKKGLFETLSTFIFLPAVFNKCELKPQEYRRSYWRLTPVNIQSKDGVHLEGFHRSLKETNFPPSARHLVIIFNSNNENARSMPYINRLTDKMLERLNYNGDTPTDFLFFNYRGVGSSDPCPIHNAQDLITDGFIAFDWAKNWSLEHNVDLSHITLYGNSIGASIATAVATKNPQVHMNINHTFTNWTEAAAYIVNTKTHSYLGEVLRPLFYLLKGQLLNPQAFIKDYLIRQARMDVENIGTLWVTRALNDTLLGAQASLDVRRDFPNFNRDRVRVTHVQGDHLEWGKEILYDSTLES